MNAAKFSLRVLWIIPVALLFISTSCQDRCSATQTFYVYEPIYEQMDVFRSAVLVTEPREIETPGRIYFKDGFLLINEPGQGFHVIDNRDTSNPITLSFVEIPGNFDMAAQGNYLYVDSYLDLVIFDISDINQIVEINRQEDIFLESYLNNGTWSESLGILTEYSEDIVTQDVDCKTPTFRGGCVNCVWLTNADMASGNNNLATASKEFSTNSSSTGIGGSMARFTITKGHLYTLDHFTLRSFDLAISENPTLMNTVDVGWGLETIFPYGDHLFMGANSGMWVYNISQPADPVFTSNFSHMTACDPVVVQGDYAYVTLRDGRQCQGWSNELDVIDISNISNPTLVNTVPMQNPHGLGIDGTCLFVCEGEHGLKFFDISNVMDIENNMFREYKGIHALDVIPLNNNLMMIGNDGLYQYSYFCGTDNLELLSSIPITWGK